MDRGLDGLLPLFFSILLSVAIMTVLFVYLSVFLLNKTLLLGYYYYYNYSSDWEQKHYIIAVCNNRRGYIISLLASYALYQSSNNIFQSPNQKLQ
jgi:hypothetical protein